MGRAIVPLTAPDLPDLDHLVTGRLEQRSELHDHRRTFGFLIDEGTLRLVSSGHTAVSG
jgi:hypothetical protein